MWEPHVPYEVLSFQCLEWLNKESGRARVTSPSTKPDHWVGNSSCLSASYYFALRHQQSTSTLLFQAFNVKTRSESIRESDTTESFSLPFRPSPNTYHLYTYTLQSPGPRARMTSHKEVTVTSWQMWATDLHSELLLTIHGNPLFLCGKIP